MRIAHIASHRGNIGDVINHEGFYKSVIGITPADEVVRIEIRDFYFNSRAKKRFDKQFAEQLNDFDVVIFGGGGFFDLQWVDSSTGTTLNFLDGFIESLQTKVIINAMGYHEYPDKMDNRLFDQFKCFINNILSR